LSSIQGEALGVEESPTFETITVTDQNCLPELRRNMQEVILPAFERLAAVVESAE